jgi:polysaccharide lyase-like protein
VRFLKPISAAITALVLLAAAPAADAGLVFDGRWQSPGVNNWDGVLTLKPGNRNKLRYVKAPRRRGWGYAADLRVGGNAASERIEFQENLFPNAEGQDHWWAWSFRIARDSTIPSIAFLTQMYSRFNGTYCSIPRGGASNSLRMMNPVRGRRSDRWYWTITGGNGRCRITHVRIPGLRVVKERWIDFTCHLRWSSTPAGLSKCYYRVQPRKAWRRAFKDVGPNLVTAAAADAGLSLSQGLYKAEARPYVHVTLGGLVIADTRAEAQRAAFSRKRPIAAAAATTPRRTLAPIRERTRARELLVVAPVCALGAVLVGRLFVRRRHARRRRRRAAMRSAGR